MGREGRRAAAALFSPPAVYLRHWAASCRHAYSSNGHACSSYGHAYSSKSPYDSSGSGGSYDVGSTEAEQGWNRRRTARTQKLPRGIV